MMNDLRRLDFNLLRVFAILMDELNVSRAAKRLGLSQPATSNALNRLRQTLDDELLVRRGNEMQPTVLALEFRPFVLSALAEVARGLEKIATFEPAEMDGTMTIGIDQYSLVVLGSPLISALREQAPKLNVSLVSAPPHEQEDKLIKGVFDFMVGQVWWPTPQLDQDVLFTENFVGLTRVGHPLTKAQDPVSIDEYLRYQHILFSERGRVSRNVDTGLSDIGRVRDVKLTVPSLTLAAEHVERSDDILNLGQRMTTALMQRYELAIFEIPLKTDGFDITLQWSSQNTGSALNEWFRKLVLQVVPNI